MEDGIHTLAYGHYRLKKLKGRKSTRGAGGRYFLDIHSSWDRQFREWHNCSTIAILFTTYMLRGLWQALNCLSMHATYYVIIAGTLLRDCHRGVSRANKKVVCERSLYHWNVLYFSYKIFLIAKQFQKCKYNAAVRKCTPMSNKDVVQW